MDNRSQPAARRRGIAFILGGQRSGTTLLAMVLATHPRLAVLRPGPSGKILQRIQRLLSTHPAETEMTAYMRRQTSYSHYLLHRLWRHTHRYREGKGLRVRLSAVRPYDRLVLKHTPSTIDFLTLLRYLSESPRIVFLVRHPYAVVASMVTPLSGDGEDPTTFAGSYRVRQAFDPLFQRHSVLDYGRYRLRCAEDLEGLPHHIRAALLWRYQNLVVTQIARAFDESTLLLSYEDLVHDREKSLRAVTSALRIQWDDRLLRHHDFYSGARGHGGIQTGRPIDESSHDKWRKVLTREQVDDIRQITHDVAEHLGYQLRNV